MHWNVTYSTLRIGRVSFHDDENLNHPVYEPEGTTADEAIQSVKDYITEVYKCNECSSRPISNGIEVFDPDDNSIIDTYTDFFAEPVYTLIGSDGKPYRSSHPGQFGGHNKLKIYGKLDCPSAKRAIAKGQYVKHRVFFADEETAIKAGYRPCGICMKAAYKKWKATTKGEADHDQESR